MDILQALQEEQSRREEGLKLIDQGQELIMKGQQLLKTFTVLKGGSSNGGVHIETGSAYRKDVIGKIEQAIDNSPDKEMKQADIARAIGVAVQSVYTALNREKKKKVPRVIMGSQKGWYKRNPKTLHHSAMSA